MSTEPIVHRDISPCTQEWNAKSFTSTFQNFSIHGLMVHRCFQHLLVNLMASVAIQTNYSILQRCQVSDRVDRLISPRTTKEPRPCNRRISSLKMWHASTDTPPPSKKAFGLARCGGLGGGGGGTQVSLLWISDIFCYRHIWLQWHQLQWQPSYSGTFDKSHVAKKCQCKQISAYSDHFFPFLEGVTETEDEDVCILISSIPMVEYGTIYSLYVQGFCQIGLRY